MKKAISNAITALVILVLFISSASADWYVATEAEWAENGWFNTSYLYTICNG